VKLRLWDLESIGCCGVISRRIAPEPPANFGNPWFRDQGFLAQDEGDKFAGNEEGAAGPDLFDAW
jgi:hypothetical protein